MAESERHQAVAPAVSLFLTPDELAEWTGFKRRAKIIWQLRRWNVQFRTPFDGWPRVLRGARVPVDEPTPAAEDTPQAALVLDGPAAILREPCVYFAQVRWRDGTLGLIKIGYTENLQSRMGTLWRQLYDRRLPKLLVHLTLPGDKDLEAHYHRRFDHLRVEGEWFEDCAEIRQEFGLC